MRSALCLAVDPDLLVTVNAMTGGYVVNDGPDVGPSTPTHPGAGQDAAVNWLNRLRTLAQRMCVAPPIYAQADLDALQRVGDPGLSSIATNGAGDIVDQILGISVDPGRHPRRRRPAHRPRRPTVVVAGPDRRRRRGQSRRARFGDGGHRPPPTSPASAIRRKWLPLRSTPPSPRRWPPRAPTRGRRRISIPRWTFRSSTTRQWRVARTHWVRCCGGAFSRRPSRAVRSLMPPMDWSLQADDAAAVLTAVATSIRAGLAVPRPLSAVIAESQAVPQQDLRPLPDGVTGNPRARFDDAVTLGIAATSGRLWGLNAALTTDERTGLTGTQYTAPLREDMLRALSQSVPPDARNGLAQQRLAADQPYGQ